MIEILKEIGLENLEEILYKDRKFCIIKFRMNGKIFHTAYFLWNGKWNKVYQQENNELTFLGEIPSYYQKILKDYVPVDKVLWRIVKDERKTY